MRKSERRSRVALLVASTSPHLQQQDNPVDWQEWGREAVAEAPRRPMLLSVGYAACRCHHVCRRSVDRTSSGHVPEPCRWAPEPSGQAIRADSLRGVWCVRGRRRNHVAGSSCGAPRGPGCPAASSGRTSSMTNPVIRGPSRRPNDKRPRPVTWGDAVDQWCPRRDLNSENRCPDWVIDTHPRPITAGQSGLWIQRGMWTSRRIRRHCDQSWDQRGRRQARTTERSCAGEELAAGPQVSANVSGHLRRGGRVAVGSGRSWPGGRCRIRRRCSR